MAEDATVDTDFTEPEGTVTLVSPSGAEYRTHNAIEINNLVYGQGYKFKDEAAADDAKSETDSPVPAPTPAAEAGSVSTTEAPTAPPTTPAAATGKSSAKPSVSKPSTSGTPTPPSS